MVLSQEEALLRIALLVSRADGHLRPHETQAAVQALPGAFRNLTDEQLQQLLETAEADVAATPEPEMLDRIVAGLHDRPARVQALTIACLVAGADQKLSWRETSHLSRLAERLGLSPREVSRVVRTVQ